MSPILNASMKLLTENSGTLPDVSGAMNNYFQEMVFVQILKEVVNYKTVETPVTIAFRGVWQPSGAQQNQMRPDGQQSWASYELHAEVSLVLNPDDVVTYQGKQYRVSSKTDYSLYGYVHYTLIEDYSGSGPQWG